MDVKEKLNELLDTARRKYEEYREDRYQKLREAKTRAEFEAVACNCEFRHSFYERELISNGVTVLKAKVVGIDQFNKWIPASEPPKGE